MIVTPKARPDTDVILPQRPRSSIPRLQDTYQEDINSVLYKQTLIVPPIPLDFIPDSKTLILATRKRIQSIKSHTKPHDRNRRVLSRNNRRVKSAASQFSECSDDDTNHSVNTDAEWGWLDEKFDYDKDSDEEFTKKSQETVGERSVTLYLNACKNFQQVPSRIVLKSLKTKELALKSSHLGPKGAKALAVTLALNSNLEIVDLTGNDIGSEGTNYLCQSLAENVFITELTLAENNLQSAGAKYLAQAIKTNDHIKVLNISGNGFEEYDAVHIGEIIRENYTITELYLAHNAFRERGGQIIANALAENGSLQILDLSWNHLRRKGAIAIAECLRNNVGLKRLNLAWNGLAMEGSRALKRSLPENHTLIQLDLTCNRINFDCLTEILKGLKKNEMIASVKLCHNFLTTEGHTLLLNTLQSTPNWPVKDIDISTEMVDMDFVLRYEEMRRSRVVFIKYGMVKPCYVQLDKMTSESEAFLKDDPMIVLMEFMRLSNLRLVDLFTSLDVDGSQSLSREEFQQGLLHANIPLSPECLDKLIKHLDSNNDGEVDFTELLDGLKAHKRKVSKILKKQKHLKFEETEIGIVSLKINAMLQFRMLFHKMSLAKNTNEKEAMENTLQEYSDKLSDLGSMKKDMIQASMDRARKAALDRKESSINKRDSGMNKIKKFSQAARALSAPIKKK